MGYTNSGLADFKRLSPNHSGQRNHVIDDQYRLSVPGEGKYLGSKEQLKLKQRAYIKNNISTNVKNYFTNVLI